MAADDTVIGRAFRWSVVAFIVIGVVIAAVVYWKNRAPEPENIAADPVVLPKRQALKARPPVVRFTDITAEAGIAWVHENGATGAKLLPETMGPGCAFFDYDSDGDPDLLLVNSRRWPDDPRGPGTETLALYQNDGRGKFLDVTRGSGLDVQVYGMGAAVGDYDNDGHVDVFVTTLNKNRLFKNDGGKFTEVTGAAGVGGADDAWSTSAGFFDVENDGDLDLFVCNYVRWSKKIDLALDYRLVGLGRAYGPPTNFEGAQPYFYLNKGDGTFREMASEAGLHVTNPATGIPVAKALALLPIDADRDGWMDLLIANDTVKNFFFRNQGDGTFEELGDMIGVAYDNRGSSTGAMGLDGAFYRNDGVLGIGVGNFATEMSSFYVTAEAGTLLFSDEAIAEGIGPVSRQMLSFGLFFFDYDLDGRLDLFQTNGHLEEEINKVQPSQHYRQPSQLFWNCGPEHSSSFVPVDVKKAGDLGKEVVGRSAAFADIDGDGDLDIVITQAGDGVLLLRNDQDEGHHWLRLRLEGAASNRDAIGAWVEVEAGGKMQRQQVMPTRSYLAQVEKTLTFGLGNVARVDAVRVYWPGQKRADERGALAVDRVHELRQRAPGKSAPAGE